jgi:hypothetical protein
LRKKGGKKVRQPLGLCITKAFPPTDAPEKTIINIGGKEATGKVKLLPNKTGMRVKAAEKVPEFIPPKHDNVERKLQILPMEWFIESSYRSEDVAALYAFWQPTQGPFLIVTSLAREESTADFTLTIFSSSPVEVKKLEESKNFVLSGKWNEKTSGGCHLNDRAFESKPDRFTWINNPKFHLRLQTPEPTSVKITLSRPEKVWKKQIAKSAVACMMGFYVYE